MATHPTALAVTTLSFPLGDGQAFHFVFSNKTEHDGLCLAVREQLIAVGVTVWQQQKNIPKDSDNWFTEWFPNAIKAVKIVCFISAEYLRSPYCMKEFRVAQNVGNLLVVACEPIAEIMAVMEEVKQGKNKVAADALAYLMGGGQVIFHGVEDTAQEILKFLPSVAAAPEPEPQPALGLPPAQPAPKVSTIKNLAALSEATGETEADLLGYSDADLEAVLELVKVDVIGKNRIRREVASLRELLQSEPEPEPAPQPQPQPQPQPCTDQRMLDALAIKRERLSDTI
jgi:hypothetical protein